MRTKDHADRYDVRLRSGSLLVMRDGVEHCLVRDGQDAGAAGAALTSGRFNVTFRSVATERGMGNYYFYNRGATAALGTE